MSIQGVLEAHWSPVATRPLIAFSTAQRSANPPGWQANNDLWLLTPPTLPIEDEGVLIKPVQILPPNTQGLYPWWGTTFTWSPDGRKLAYARANQIGIIDLTGVLQDGEISLAPLSLDEQTMPLIDFTPLQTFSDWVWVPGPSWSPDGNFIAAAIHGPPLTSEPAEESQVFDLWLFDANGDFAVKVAEQVGMWANPAWGQAGIAFGQAVNPLQSVNSRYFIYVMDRDGSNKRQIFPFSEETGVQLPELAWSPDGEELLFIYNGNVYKTRSDGGLPQQLSADAQASHPQWAIAHSPVLTGATTLAESTGITTTGTLTGP
jgi:WD40 repeat protein